MKRNTATQLLRLLSEEELRKLSKFLRSPYFNYSPSITTLFECLRKWHPEYEHHRIRPHIHWKKIFPKKPFSEQGYWKLNFKLRCLIERFMAVEKMESNETEFKKQLIKSYADRSAHSHFENEIQYLVKKIKRQSWQDIHSYSEALWLKHDYFFNASTDKYGSALFSVEDAMDELDRFYVLAKLRFATEIKNRGRMFSKKYNIKLLPETIAVSNKYEEENPAYLMYKKVLDIYVPEKAAIAFQDCKKLLQNKFTLLSKHDQNEVMLNLRNHAIRELNKGRKEFWKEIFDLYKLGLELDLILDNHKISVNAFGNIVKAGCVVGQFLWTEKFIEKYEIYLDDHLRKDASTHSLGMLHFYKKNYDKTIDLLVGHQFTQILFQIDARIVLIKARYYQFLENMDLYFFYVSTLAADEKYIRRATVISEQKKKIHLNFILAVKKIIEMIFNKMDQKEIKNKMKKLLHDEKQIISKAWLLEIVDDL